MIVHVYVHVTFDPFQVVVPWCSPVSIRALLWIKPFIPDLELSQIDVSDA